RLHGRRAAGPESAPRPACGRRRPSGLAAVPGGRRWHRICTASSARSLLHRTAKALVLDTLLIRILAVRLPWLFSGRALHRMALGACAAAAYAAATPLFDRAAERYLVGLEVESLARLRVHPL